MKEAKLFSNGQSQAVRLPKEFRFQGKSVYIKHLGDYVVLIPKDKPWKNMFDACNKFTADFMTDRDQGNQEDRENISL
jgi:antitoxin VapB